MWMAKMFQPRREETEKPATIELFMRRNVQVRDELPSAATNTNAWNKTSYVAAAYTNVILSFLIRPNTYHLVTNCDVFVEFYLFKFTAKYCECVMEAILLIA